MAPATAYDVRSMPVAAAAGGGQAATCSAVCAAQQMACQGAREVGDGDGGGGAWRPTARCPSDGDGAHSVVVKTRPRRRIRGRR